MGAGTSPSVKPIQHNNTAEPSFSGRAKEPENEENNAVPFWHIAVSGVAGYEGAAAGALVRKISPTDKMGVPSAASLRWQRSSVLGATKEAKNLAKGPPNKPHTAVMKRM